jgi:hypothetical protein
MDTGSPTEKDSGKDPMHSAVERPIEPERTIYDEDIDVDDGFDQDELRKAVEMSLHDEKASGTNGGEWMK